jgi:hypothetical protein
MVLSIYDYLNDLTEVYPQGFLNDPRELKTEHSDAGG